MPGKDFTHIHSFTFHSNHTCVITLILEMWNHAMVKGGKPTTSSVTAEEWGRRQDLNQVVWLQREARVKSMLYSTKAWFLLNYLSFLDFHLQVLPYLFWSRHTLLGVYRWVSGGPWILGMVWKFFMCMPSYILLGERIYNFSKVIYVQKKKKD